MTQNIIISQVANQTGINQKVVSFCFNSFNDGSTIPFLARYRKDEIGGINENDLRNIKDCIDEINTLLKRKEYIIETIENLGKLTPQIEEQINNCFDKNVLEDIYLPFKKSKTSKADKAIEMGLEKLGNHLFFLKENLDEQECFNKLVDKKFNGTQKEAFSFAIDIVIEKISSHLTLRDIARENLNKFGKLEAKKKRGFDGDTDKYRDYLDYSESLNRTTGNRIMAVFRGVNDGVLSKKVGYDFDILFDKMNRYLRRDNSNKLYPYFKKALEDAIKKSIVPAIETEIFNSLFERAENEALEVSKKNLNALLMGAPAGNKIIFSIDPGYKNGCKSVIIGKNGELLDKVILFPFFMAEKSTNEFITLVKKHSVELVVIGDGTASKETYKWAKEIVKNLSLNVVVTIVSEAGASIYSASQRAIEEFPNLDISYRGAVSIGRRVQEPMAEIVKMDPKSIGVGQYQYDLTQTKLDNKLKEVVESAVNSVGCDINLTSSDLLNYISGLSKTVSNNIIKFREENGSFNNLQDLLKVKGLGAKAFQQCSGFLRIDNGQVFLDSTSLHPETYPVIEKIIGKKAINITQEDLLKLDESTLMQNGLEKENAKFIITEINKQKRDPREDFKVIDFADGVDSIDDIIVGMQLNAKINNITTFGFFVDIGIKENGLVHKSQVKNMQKYSLGDFVLVEVIEVDIPRKRISLKVV